MGTLYNTGRKYYYERRLSSRNFKKNEKRRDESTEMQLKQVDSQ